MKTSLFSKRVSLALAIVIIVMNACTKGTTPTPVTQPKTTLELLPGTYNSAAIAVEGSVDGTTWANLTQYYDPKVLIINVGGTFTNTQYHNGVAGPNESGNWSFDSNKNNLVLGSTTYVNVSLAITSDAKTTLVYTETGASKAEDGKTYNYYRYTYKR